MALFLSFVILVIDSVTLVELVNASGRGHELLLSGIERMAIRACIDFQFFHRRSGFECVTACRTGNFHLIIFRMDVLFHVFSFCHDFYFTS